MKKYTILLLCLLLLTISGCADPEVLSNDIYTIYEVNDGKLLLSFHKQLVYPQYDHSASERPPKFQYKSLGDMKRVIENGSFSAAEQKNIQKFFGNSSALVNVCNIYALSDAKLPNNAASSTVHWYGSTYSIDIDAGDVYGMVNITSKELVEWEEECWGNRTSANRSISIISEETEADRNASVIVFDAVTVGERWKEIRYNYSAKDTKMVILERYLCSDSETSPQAIYMWGQSNGEYFTVYLYGFTERPSYEWVTSFGLKPYVETETE